MLRLELLSRRVFNCSGTEGEAIVSMNKAVLVRSVREDGAQLSEMVTANVIRVALPFGHLGSRRRGREMTRAELHARTTSRSLIVTSSEDEKARLSCAIGELFDELCLIDGGHSGDAVLHGRVASDPRVLSRREPR